MTALLLAVLMLAQITPAQAERLRWVPNPRVATSAWVADPSHHLKPATVDSLNAIIAALSRETGSEIAVVAIDSTSGFEPFDVALALHRMWGVGQKGRDNGIVLLWVPSQRAVQISVGYGLEGVLPDSRAGRIRDQAIFPAFRRGEFDAGVLAGVAALAAVAREEPDARGSTMSTTNPPPNARAGEPPPARQVSGRTGRVVGGVGAAMLLLAGGAVVYRRRRRRPRPCPRGHGLMVLLDEVADDAQLDRGARMEETLESIDYDVWMCPTCRYELAVPHRSWFSRYTECPSCKRRTLETETRTVVAATTLHEGEERVDRRCRNCDWARTDTRVLPRIVEAATAAAAMGSMGGSGGSSGGGGGSSGGSGGGGSFGGGSAGGGGAGGKY